MVGWLVGVCGAVGVVGCARRRSTPIAPSTHTLPPQTQPNRIQQADEILAKCRKEKRQPTPDEQKLIDEVEAAREIIIQVRFRFATTTLSFRVVLHPCVCMYVCVCECICVSAWAAPTTRSQPLHA